MSAGLGPFTVLAPPPELELIVVEISFDILLISKLELFFVVAFDDTSAIDFLTAPSDDPTIFSRSSGRITLSMPCNSTSVPDPQFSKILPAVAKLPSFL